MKIIRKKIILTFASVTIAHNVLMFSLLKYGRRPGLIENPDISWIIGEILGKAGIILTYPLVRLTNTLTIALGIPSQSAMLIPMSTK